MAAADPGHLGALEHPGQADAAAVGYQVQTAERHGVECDELLAHEGKRVGAHVQAQHLELDGHLLARAPRRHEGQRSELVVDRELQRLALGLRRPLLRSWRRRCGREAATGTPCRPTARPAGAPLVPMTCGCTSGTCTSSSSRRVSRASKAPTRTRLMTISTLTRVRRQKSGSER